MGIFNSLFGGSSEPKEEKTLPWQPLNGSFQLESLIEKSKSKTQLIFKHSTRCGISRMVMNQFTANFDLDLNVDLHYLDLLNDRAVSNEVAEKFQVVHESPQLLIIKNGTAVENASHGAINELDLKKFE